MMTTLGLAQLGIKIVLREIFKNQHLHTRTMANNTYMSPFSKGVSKYESKIDLVGSLSTGIGVAGIAIPPAFTAAFDQSAIEEKGFEEVLSAIEAIGNRPDVIDGYNVVLTEFNTENLIDPWNPDAGLINKYDFSGVLAPYAEGLTKIIAGEVVSGALLAVGAYTLIKNKKASTALFGASTGAAIYSAITASQYAKALSEMPFQIGGENLADYCANYPQFAENMSGLVSDLASKLSTSKGVSIALATIASAAFIYSAIKNTTKKVDSYNTQMIE